jgi:hypothetical protein
MEENTENTERIQMSARKGFWMAVGCAGIIGLLAFGGVILQSGGFLTLAADFNEQQLPFSVAAWKGVRSGSPWLWGVDLGSSLITTFSFYNLGSPFFWLTLPFPVDSFPRLAGFLFILKYMTAAGSGYVYLRRFCGTPAAVTGALIYAFSGFQATNLMFSHFHDVVAFFPLLLTGLEDHLRENGKAELVFAAFLNCLVNYFFFVQSAVFLAVYFLFRADWRQPLRHTLRKAGGCLLCGAWGVCMAGILFLPNLLYVLGSERSAAVFSASDLMFPPEDLLHLAKGILLPADTMESLSAVKRYDFNSASCYLPLFGIAYALAYVMKKRDWLGKLLLLLAALSLFPAGNALFLLFRGTYQRWWYARVMMMALATARVLEAPEDYPVRRAIGTELGLIGLLAACIWLLARREDSGIHIYDGGYLRALFLCAVVGAGFLMLPFRGRHRSLILLGAACVFCAGTTALTLRAYRDHEWNPGEVKARFEAGLRLEIPEEQYRFNSSDNLLMMPGNAGGYGAFISTAENGSYRFSRLAGYYLVNNTGNGFRPDPLPRLLGGRYGILEEEDDGTSPEAVTAEGKVFRITEGEACPIGFAVDRWIREEDLLALPMEERAVALMHAFAADGETAGRLRDEGVPRLSGEESGALELEESIRRTVQDAVTDFHRDGKGFSCASAWDRDRFVYFSVPYDTGWRAEIDGSRAEIIPSGGMMVLRVPAGAPRIDFTYHTPGFGAGAALSGVSGLGFLLYRAAARRKKRRQRGPYCHPADGML